MELQGTAKRVNGGKEGKGEKEARGGKEVKGEKEARRIKVQDKRDTKDNR